MSASLPGSDEAAVIDRLRGEDISRAELFFRSAKSLADPVSGFEDADFWSIQALLLMSLYMLAVSKRNASYAYFGEVSCCQVILRFIMLISYSLCHKVVSNRIDRDGSTFCFCLGAS